MLKSEIIIVLHHARTSLLENCFLAIKSKNLGSRSTPKNFTDPQSTLQELSFQDPPPPRRDNSLRAFAKRITLKTDFYPEIKTFNYFIFFASNM